MRLSTPIGRLKHATQLDSNRANAIFCHPGQGPVFGGGHDLKITNNTAAFSMTGSYYRFRFDGERLFVEERNGALLISTECERC